MAIGYFGRFKTVSSLYWENVSGLQTAATVLWSSTDEAAHKLIHDHGITHIAAIAADNFLPHLFELASPSSRARTLSESFQSRLLDLRKAPRWLRPIPFRPRFPDHTDRRAYLYQVVPEQNELDASWNIAVAELASGNTDEGGAEFEQAIKGVIPSRRPELYESAGRTAYQAGAHRLAVRLLGSALALRPSYAVAANIAWIRATTADDGVRDGRAALATGERLTAQDPNDMMALDVLGAALAENARFQEAGAAAQRMLSIARGRADTAGEQRAMARIRSYAAGRPWRQ
jgi:tetratricopeptide (TPR) repeat protein